MTNTSLLRSVVLLCGVSTAALATPSFAQDDQAAATTDDASAEAEQADNVIMVQAQKRDENVQDVPIAITALGTEEIAASGITGVEDLRAAVPALNVTTAVAGFGLPRIRGIGATGQGPGVENPVSVYVDGVYYGSAFGVLQSLFDTEQVAVLKGPQGTLFGRNATGGLIQITTLGPEDYWTAKAQFGYGNYETVSSAGYVAGPLAKGVAISLSGQNETQNDGFGRNLFIGSDVQDNREWAMRGKLRFDLGDMTSVLLSGDFNGRDATDPAFLNFSINTLGQNVPAQIVTLGGDPERDILADVDPFVRARQWGVSGTIDHDFGGVTLKSITAYRHSELESFFDPDGTTVRQLVIDNFQLDKQFTQEINLISDGGGPFQWVLGAYYMHDKAGLLPRSRTQGLAIAGTVGPAGYIDNVTRVELDSYSAFAQGTYAISDATNITAGLRYTIDKRSFEGETVTFHSITRVTTTTPYTPRELEFSEPSWRLSIDHRFSDQFMAYASYNRGFRAGAFGPQVINSAIPILTPEQVDAFEVGIKSDLWDNRVRLNLSAYYNDQSSVQVMQVISGVQNIYNAQGAEIYGIDGDITVEVTDNFKLFGGFNWAHGRYKEFTDAVISIPFPVPATFSTTQFSYVDSTSGATVANTVCLGTFVPPNITTQAGRDAFYRTRLGGNCLLRSDASGNKLQNSPELTFSLGARWDIPTSIGNFTLAGNYYYNDGYVGTPDERVAQDSFSIVNASLRWTEPDEHYYLELWGRNLTDAFYRSQIGASNSGDNGYSGAPRTYGLTLGFNY